MDWQKFYVYIVNDWFKVTQPDRDDPNKMRTDYLTPCSPGAAGAIEMNWMDIEPDQLFEPYVSMQVCKG